MWAPAAIAVVYVLNLLRALGTVRDSLASHADFASAPVIAELMSHRAPDSVVTLGDYRWYEALWLLRGTKWLPWHQTIWEFVPFAVWALGIACVYVAVKRISTRWAAITAAALVVCGGSTMKVTLWSLDTHGPAAVHAAILGLAVVLLAQARGRERFRRWALLSAPLLIAVTAFGGTDPLVFGVAIGPFLVATLALAWRTADRAVAIYGLVVALGSAIGAKLLIALGEHSDLSWTHKAVSWIGPDHIADQLGLLPGALSGLVSQSVFGEVVGGTSTITMAGALLGLVAMVVVVRAAVRAVWPVLWAGIGTPPADEAARRDAARDAFFVFWIVVIAAACAQFVLTSAAFDTGGGRYLVGAWIGVCAMLPVVAERAGTQLIASATVAAIALVALALFVRNPKPTGDSPYPTRAQVAQIEAYAKSVGATKGYGGFWTSIPATWQSRFGLEIYPIFPCTADHNCPMYQHQISSWYTPGNRGRRLLLVDSRLPLQPVIDPAFGKPIAQRTFGSTTVYLYPADFSDKLG